MIKNHKAMLVLTGIFCMSSFGSRNMDVSAAQISVESIEKKSHNGAPATAGFFDYNKRSLARSSFNEVYREQRLSQISGMKNFKNLLDHNDSFANALVSGAEKIAKARKLNVLSNNDRKKIIKDMMAHIIKKHGSVVPILEAYSRNPGRVLSALKSGKIEKIDELYNKPRSFKLQSDVNQPVM